MVSFCSFQISFPNTCTVLIFFIAGLLFLCLEHVEHWERIASRWRPAFSSHLVNALIVHLDSNFRLRLLGARRIGGLFACYTDPALRAFFEYLNVCISGRRK